MWPPISIDSLKREKMSVRERWVIVSHAGRIEEMDVNVPQLREACHIKWSRGRGEVLEKSLFY